MHACTDNDHFLVGLHIASGKRHIYTRDILNGHFAHAAAFPREKMEEVCTENCQNALHTYNTCHIHTSRKKLI
jgi:hypothetical protein